MYKNLVIVALLEGASALTLKSDPICSSAGCTQYLHKHTKPTYAVDYPVPNLGQDRDIADSLASERDASKLLKHNWEFGTKKSKAKWHNVAKDTLYDFDPTLDEDILTSHKNVADAEKNLDHVWNIEAVQLGSDPICSSAGCTQYKHKAKPLGYPIDYFVPNFGQDHDIQHNFNSLDIAEK